MEHNVLCEAILRCADLFYRNKEQEAYQNLNELLPQITQGVQLVVNQNTEEKVNQYVMSQFHKFADAYQNKDILGIADSLFYEITEVIGMGKE